MNSTFCEFYGCNVQHVGDGQGECGHCGSQFVLHQCSYHGLGGVNGLNSISEWKWLPVVMPLVKATCQECGITIELAQKAEAHFDLPEWAVAILNGVAAAAVIVAGVTLYRRLSA